MQVIHLSTIYNSTTIFPTIFTRTSVFTETIHLSLNQSVSTGAVLRYGHWSTMCPLEQNTDLQYVHWNNDLQYVHWNNNLQYVHWNYNMSTGTILRHFRVNGSTFRESNCVIFFFMSLLNEFWTILEKFCHPGRKRSQNSCTMNVQP